MKGALHRWIQRTWYEGGKSYVALLPLAGLYWLIIESRRLLYHTGVLRAWRANVPVIVVGNITAGGTGKTPVTIWLAQVLRQHGFAPGIVSRGYGGSRSGASMRVDSESDPAVVGDEPVLIARRTGCPVVVDADRARAVAMLLADGVDLIIADDGLQHYALDRDYEICVVDGERGTGNGLLLPAGPMRESVARIEQVDQVLVNGHLRQDLAGMPAGVQNAIEFDLVANDVCRLNGSLARPIDRFAGTTVHAVAAIGNPVRFFDLLRSHGIQVIEHAFPDHATIPRAELDFEDQFDVLMTEKDAVKFPRVASDRFWYVPVDAHIDPLACGPWVEQMESRLRSLKGDS